MDGDIYPDLVTKYCDILAIPLTHIFNAVLRVGEWPRCWRTETVVIIPKKASPDNLGQCRNLSFTPLFSKTLEKFVFEKLASQAKISTRQYGGIRKCRVEHFLVDAWDSILRGLETPGQASGIISLDFEKAFNRLDHSSCIKALRRHGVNQEVINVIIGFLTGRLMRVRVGSTLSEPRTVTAEARKEVSSEIYFHADH